MEHPVDRLRLGNWETSDGMLGLPGTGTRLDRATKDDPSGDSQRLLRGASDLSTRWQRNGHAMVTTGTED